MENITIVSEAVFVTAIELLYTKLLEHNYIPNPNTTILALSSYIESIAETLNTKYTEKLKENSDEQPNT